MESLFQQKRLLLLILAATCLGLTLLVFLSLTRLHQQEQQSRFQQQADYVHRYVERNLNRKTESITHLAAFFESSRHVEPHEFEQYSARILERHRQLQALLWIPAVATEQQQQFIETTQQQFTGFTLEPAILAEGQYHYPVLYIHPQSDQKPEQGHDFAANNSLRQFLDSAGREVHIKTGLSLSDTENSAATNLIIKRINGWQPLHNGGFVAGIFDLDGIFQGLYTSTIASNLLIESSNGRILYASPGYTDNPDCYTRGLELPGQNWLLASCPADRISGVPMTAYGILLLGFIATGLLMGNFYYLYQRHSLVEKKFQERTAEIEQTRNLLEKASQAKSAFIANMSHEIKTPLHGITCSLELIRKADNTDKEHSLRTIQNSVDYLIHTVDEVLDFANLEASRLKLELVPVNITQLYKSVCAGFQQQAYAQGLQFHTRLPKDPLPTVMADPKRLRQVLFNLLSNAIKFTDEGYIEFFISLEQLDEKVITLAFTIADSGIGISDEFSNQLFDFFSREHTDYKQRYSGVGLGLAISKQLVELMGGKLSMKQNNEHGCCFILTLPFNITDDQPLDLTALKQQGRNYQKTVLLAEDNLVNQMVTRKLLENLGLEVDTANDGKEAIEKIQHRTYDLVLMDIQMPEMDGIEATRHIRNQLKLGTIIIALSANTQDQDIRASEEAGMNSFLKKPLHTGLLIRELDRLFGL